MSKVIDDLYERMRLGLDDLKQIEDQWGSDRSAWPAGQAERYERQKANVTKLGYEIEDAQQAEKARAEQVEGVRELARSGKTIIETGDGPASGRPFARRSDPWAEGQGDNVVRMDTADGLATRAQDAIEIARGFSPAGRELLARVADREDTGPEGHALIIAATSDAYRTAFQKVIRDSQRGHMTWTESEREAYARVESLRTAMSLTNANGGYLVPFVLDSSINLTNDGTASFIRQLARVETTTSKDWNGVNSTGVNFEHLAEAASATDASPTFSRVTVPMVKAAAYLIASYEVDQDTDIASQIPMLLAEGRSRIEATSFTTGNGTTAPEGIVTGVVAVTASRVSATTGGSFSSQSEVYKVWNALTPRARQSKKAAWLAHNSTLSTIRQWDTAGGSAFWGDLAEDLPPRLIGKPIFEASDMASTVTTGSSILLAGDFSQYLIVDRIGTILTDMAMVTDTDGKPTFQRGWAAHFRYGAKVADPNASRLLRL